MHLPPTRTGKWTMQSQSNFDDAAPVQSHINLQVVFSVTFTKKLYIHLIVRARGKLVDSNGKVSVLKLPDQSLTRLKQIRVFATAPSLSVVCCSTGQTLTWAGKSSDCRQTFEGTPNRW